MQLTGRVHGVHLDRKHRFRKEPADTITLVEGLGVQGDAHAGVTVQHPSRVRRDPTLPNLRQVHLIHAELLRDLAGKGYDVAPGVLGVLGENVTTLGIDLLGLPTGSVLQLGATARVTVTGLRNPCSQIDQLGAGLLKHLLYTADDGSTVRLAGVMGVVSDGGVVRRDDPIQVTLPDADHVPLAPV